MSEHYPMPLARQRHTRALVHCLVALQLAQPFVTAAQAAELTPLTAGVSLDQAVNGVPIVNIAAPNGAGISHNQYASFNVGSEGLILNNSAQPVNTQLGGYITSNAQLGGGSARLILNEVTTASPSQLNGYMEVAGQRAGVVVANPWGISCNGCGFINTSQATLAAGIPLWNSDGSLQGYRVEDGRLRFDGLGLNAGNVDRLALYARVLELNADLYARDLAVVTGANTIAAATGAATALAASGTAPGYAIDSSALGGMYADTIRLVGTEAGVGMRLAAPVAALTGALEVRANGDVRLAQVSAQTALEVNAAGDLALAGDLAAGGNVTLEAGGALALAEGITVGGDAIALTAASLTQDAGGSIAARAALTAAAAQQTYRGDVGSADSFIITADSVINSGTIIAGLDLEVTAATLDNQGGSLAAGRDLVLRLPNFRQAQTGGTLAAQRLFRVDASGDVVMDGAALELPGDIWLQSATGDLQVDTRLVSGGSTTLLARDVSVGRDGLVAAQDQLLLEASNVANAGVLFGRQALTLRVENELVNGRSDGSVEAALLSEGDVRVSTAADGLLQRLYNHGSSIQSLGGSVTLKATDLRNINVGWRLSDPYAVPSTFEYSIDAGSFNSYHYCCGRAGEDVRSTRIETRITRTDFASEGVRGMILAGGDIRLEAGTLLNDHSSISAGGWLDITADRIDNLGTTLYDDILTVTITRWHTCEYDSMGDLDCWPVQWGPVSRPSSAEHAYLTALLEGAAGVIIRGEAANGEEKGTQGNTVSPKAEDFETLHFSPEDLLLTGLDPTALPGFQLPGNGLFQLSQDPAHPYLVETDPAVNTYQGFLGSAYLLARLEDWAPGITQRRLGDGYYEITLIRSTLMAVLGSRFVDPAITDEREQFQFLMDNAIAASDALQLSPGIALTREQIDALQADIVWMEERDIAGQRVLVPVVYLAQGSSRVLRDGAVIGGGSVVIEGDSFSNSGTVRATGDLRVTTDGDIDNLGGTLRAGGDLALTSGADISNASGQLSGANVSLVAAGDITHRTTADTYDGQGGSTRFHGTVLGEQASVSATGSVTQVAGGDLTLEGARVSGTDVSLAAGRNLLIGTVKVADGYRFTTADWQAAEEYVRYLQSEVEALGELRLAAAGDVTVIAATLTAGGDATVVAGGNVAFLAETETDHRETHSQHDGTVEDSSSDVVHDEWRTVGTTLTAGGDLAIRAARGDVTLYASTASAAGDADVSAGGTLRLVAGVDTVQHSEQHNEDGLATFANHSEGHVSQRAVASGLQAGGDLTLNAGGNIDIVASTLVADATLRIGGQAVDPALLTPQAAASLPMNVNVTTLALTNTSWSQTQKGFAGPLEEFIKIAAFTIEMVLAPFTLGQVDLPEVKVGEFSSTRTQDTWQMSSLLAAQHMDIRAQDTATFSGADLLAPGSIQVSARDIVIDAAAETHSYRASSGSDTVKGVGAELNRDAGEYRVAGVQSIRQSVADSQSSLEWRGTRIETGDLVLRAEENLRILGAQVTATGDALLEAGDALVIGGKEGSLAQTHEESTETVTVGVAVRNAYVDAALAVKALSAATDAVKDAKDALDEAERKVALGLLDESDLDFFHVNLAGASLSLVQAEIAAAGAVVAMASTTSTGGFYASASANREKTVTTTTTEQTVWQGSTLKVGGSAALLAGDRLTVQGSDVLVDKHAVAGADTSDANSNTLIVDARQITLLAGEERSHQSSDSRSDSEGISVSLNAKAGLTGGSASLGYRESEADSSSLHYVNTHLVAGTVSSRSEALRLAGAVVEADHVDIDTGALTVQSLQDEAYSKSRSYGLNIGFGFGAGTNESGGLDAALTSGGGGLDFLRSDSERRWVAEQSGIIGHDSLVVSARDTVLTGGLLANARRDDSGRLVDQGGLAFSTDTLVINHLQDVDRSKTVGANYGVSVALTPTNPGQGTTGNQPLTPAQLTAAQANQKPTPETPRGTVTLGGTYFGHVTEQLTQATLGGGRVTVGGQRLGDGSESTVTAAALGLGALNRDLSQAQLITTDEDIGGLNFVATLDLRWATPEGRADLLKEQKQAANGLFLTAMELGVSAKAAASVATDEDIALGDLWTVVKGSVAALHGTSGFVINNPAAAAQIEAQRQGENQDLEALQAATDSYTKVAGDDSSKIFATSDLAGARDATTGTIYLSSLLQSNFVEVAGHEMSHGYTKSESYADFMGWATGLVWSSSVWANSADIAAYRPDYSNAGELQERNAVLLSRNNAEYAAALADHASSFDNRYLNTAERYAIYQRATALARGDRTQAQILYARIASEALERVDGTYAQQHTGTDPWAINILNTIKVGRGTDGLFVATPAEYADTFLVEGAIVAGDEFRAIEKYGSGFTGTQLAAMEKAEAAKSINTTNAATGAAKSLTVNFGVDALNLGTTIVDGYSLMFTSTYNLFTDSNVEAFILPKLEPLMPLTDGEVKSLLVFGIPGIVETAPALLGVTRRVGTELAIMPYDTLVAYQAERAASAVEEAALAKRRIELNAQVDDFQQYDWYRKDYSAKTGGDWDWPRVAPNDGAVPGTEEVVILKPGTLIDRYGKNSGTYASPFGTPYEERALAPGTQAEPYRVYEVVEEVSAIKAVVLPAFDQKGLGEQLKLQDSIKRLEDMGLIREVVTP
ncbi:MAG: hemagglutinin repeat-containing protein [Pseudomonadota bacterium]